MLENESLFQPAWNRRKTDEAVQVWVRLRKALSISTVLLHSKPLEWHKKDTIKLPNPISMLAQPCTLRDSGEGYHSAAASEMAYFIASPSDGARLATESHLAERKRGGVAPGSGRGILLHHKGLQWSETLTVPPPRLVLRDGRHFTSLKERKRPFTTKRLGSVHNRTKFLFYSNPKRLHAILCYSENRLLYWEKSFFVGQGLANVT